MAERKLYCGFVVEPTWNKGALVDQNDNVHYDRPLPNYIDYVLRQLAPFRSEIEGVIVASEHDVRWLLDGLPAAGYRVFVTDPESRPRFGFGQKVNAVALARELVSPRLPKGQVRPAKEALGLLPGLQELFAELAKVAAQFGGEGLRTALHETILKAARTQKLSLTATGGSIDVDPYELSIPRCRKLVAACFSHAAAAVGRKTVVRKLEGLDRRRRDEGAPSLLDTLGVGDLVA